MSSKYANYDITIKDGSGEHFRDATVRTTHGESSIRNAKRITERLLPRLFHFEDGSETEMVKLGRWKQDSEAHTIKIGIRRKPKNGFINIVIHQYFMYQVTMQKV